MLSTTSLLMRCSSEIAVFGAGIMNASGSVCVEVSLIVQSFHGVHCNKLHGLGNAGILWSLFFCCRLSFVLILVCFILTSLL